MKSSKLATLFSSAALALGLMASNGQQANAGQLYNGWNYGIDSLTDGSGGDVYNIRGMAIKETSDSIFVALTGGLPLEGTANSGAADGNIGWGDLFFNFTGTNFKSASDSNSLFAVRFAGTNDSKAATTGVYKNVQATSVTTDNHGYGSLKQYYDYGWGQGNTQGTDLPTAASVYNYYYGNTVGSNPTTSNTPILNVINSGSKVGEITSLTASALAAAGLDFGHFSALGNQTIGFQIDRSLLPNGQFFSNIFIECGNDGLALAGTLTAVPESGNTMGLVALGVLFAGSQLLKRRPGKAIAG